MGPRPGRWLGAALAVLAAAAPAAAEPFAPSGDPPPPLQLAQARGENAPPAAPKAQAPAQAGANSALKQRVEQLEEQLVDMQVIIGTLESLARGVAAPASSAAAAGADPRIDGLQTQVRALTAQIEQLTTQVRALSTTAPQSADAPPAVEPAPAKQAKAAGGPKSDRFGSTTVTAGTNDAIGGLIEGQADASPKAAPAAPAEAESVAAAPPSFLPPATAPADAANPKQLYETAYGYLMQRDYSAAQSAFEEFLSRYPKDSLAGNAQYWLGEAHFVRGEYKAAAGAFLKGYQNFSGNARAADSLLKLAMSLDRLGQKDAACSSFAELSTRFPDAPDNVKTRATTEQKRIGCP